MLYDSPPKSAVEEDDEMAKLPASQKKKIRQKQRKAVARTKKVLQFVSCLSGSYILLLFILYSKIMFLLGGRS